MGVCMIEIPFWKLSSCVQDWIVTFQLKGAKKNGVSHCSPDGTRVPSGAVLLVEERRCSHAQSKMLR